MTELHAKTSGIVVAEEPASIVAGILAAAAPPAPEPHAASQGTADQGPKKRTGGGRPRSLVWQYYTQLSTPETKSNRELVKCNACNFECMSRVETMEKHVADCKEVAPEDRKLMQDRLAERLVKAAEKIPRKSSLPAYSMPASVPERRPKIEASVSRAELGEPSQLHFPNVYVPTHPLVSHWLAVCRNKLSPPPIFRSAVAELGRILIYEAAQDWLPTVDGQVETPLGLADVRFVDPSKPVKVVPILRAGLVLLEESATVLPSSETYHVGYVRNEDTLEASVYLNKLPAQIGPEDRVLISDPMIATGGTVLKVIDDLVSRGASAEFIRVISVVVAPPALEVIAKKYPGLRLYTGMIDSELNDKGYIVPGLGDAGDRAFGT